MKIIVVIIIFITDLIMIHQKQKINDLENEVQYLAKLLFDNAIDGNEHFYELIEDEESEEDDI